MHKTSLVLILVVVIGLSLTTANLVSPDKDDVSIKESKRGDDHLAEWWPRYKGDVPMEESKRGDDHLAEWWPRYKGDVPMEGSK